MSMGRTPGRPQVHSLITGCRRHGPLAVLLAVLLVPSLVVTGISLQPALASPVAKAGLGAAGLGAAGSGAAGSVPTTDGGHGSGVPPNDAADVVLKVPVNPFPPWIVVDERGTRGIDVDILDAIALDTLRRYQYIECPWQRCLKLMETGTTDLMSGLFRSAERETYLRFIEPPYYEDPPKVFYTRADSPVSIRTYEDLAPLHIGAVSGTLYFPRFDADTRLRKSLLTEDILLIRLLQAGRIDAFIGTSSEADRLIRSSGLEGRFNKWQLHDGIRGHSHFAMSRQSDKWHLHERLAEVLRRLLATGKIQELIENGLHAHE